MRTIDADALIRAASVRFYSTNYYKHILDLIDNAPTVEPCYQTTSCLDCANYDKENHNCPRFCEVTKEVIKSRPTGEWLSTGKDLKREHPYSARWYYCSCCGKYNDFNQMTNCCPYCGAQMQGGEEDEM